MIYYGYQQALAKFPKQGDPSSTKANKAAKKPRQDLWVSLPSTFSLFTSVSLRTPQEEYRR